MKPAVPDLPRTRKELAAIYRMSLNTFKRRMAGKIERRKVILCPNDLEAVVERLGLPPGYAKPAKTHRPRAYQPVLFTV